MHSVNGKKKDDEMEDEPLEEDLFILDDQKFNTKFGELEKTQIKITLWVEPIEEKLNLFIKNGSNSKKLVATIEFQQFKQLQNLGTKSSVEKIVKIIPNIDLEVAEELNAGLLQKAKENS